jgi:glycosyltransferase involved in cell wall biosynthesis
MKICYVAHVRLPTEKAYGIQIMKMCEAFALQGHEIDLILPERDNPITESVFDFYSIKQEAREKIKLHYIPSINLIKFGKIGFWLQTWWFAEASSVRMRKNYPDVVYSRDPIILLNMYFIHRNLVWEAHRGETGFAIKTLLRKAKLVSISWGLAHVYEKMTKKILIAPDGVDTAQFTIKDDKETCKRKLGFPKEKKIALYCGHLYDWKGTQTFADAACTFTNYELAVFVGGTDKDIENFKIKNADNPHVLVLGRKPHEEIPFYLKAADVLVLPNSAKEKISSHYTSPLKLFEYMASGTPIVSSDLPSLREILNEKTAVFFTPDNADDLTAAVKEVFEYGFPTESLKEVEYYTWEKRTQKIAAFIQP